MKLCKKCQKLKDESAFNKCTHNKNGLYHWCRECRNKSRIESDWKYRHSEKGINAEKKFKKNS